MHPPSYIDPALYHCSSQLGHSRCIRDSTNDRISWTGRTNALLSSSESRSKENSWKHTTHVRCSSFNKTMLMAPDRLAGGPLVSSEGNCLLDISSIMIVGEFVRSPLVFF